MKLEFDEHDYNYINGINEDLANGKNIPLFVNQVGNKYYLEFTCVDIAKANAFVSEFMRRGNNHDEEFGIQITALSYCPRHEKIKELKETLLSFIEKLDYME